ncbi:MAG: hypothetical protein R2798_01410 [Chitinophagales bacterium]|nr:hypothetical protein [Bacteroidota bacterium]MCB9042940.1 hypothetical protein [Chitinophagales bacterium]
MDKRAIVRLEIFMMSPYHNKHKNLQQLFAFIKDFYPSFDSPHFTEEQAFSFLFPKEKYKPNTITKLLSKLLKVVEKFLITDDFLQKEDENKIYLLQLYNNNSLSKLFRSTLTELEKILDNTPVRNKHFYYLQYQLENEYATYLSLNSDTRSEDIRFHELSQAFNKYYLFSKLKLLCLMYNRTQLINVQYDMILMDEILHILDEGVYEDEQGIQMMYKGLRLLMHADVEKYEVLYNLLQEHKNILSPEDYLIILTILENTVNKIFPKENLVRYEELFKLYQNRIAANLHLNQYGYIIPAILSNVVTVALLLGKYEWAENFVIAHKNNLDTSLSNEIYDLCLANIYYNQENYDAARNILLTERFTDVFAKMTVRRLLPKIYYDEKEMELLEANINSSRVYISRLDAIFDSYIQQNQVFYNNLQRLTKIFSSDKNAWKRFHQELSQNPDTFDYFWFLQKFKLYTSS